MSAASSSRRTVRCATRALKNARFLHSSAPHQFAAPESAEAFGSSIPIEVLARLHRLRPESGEVAAHPVLAAFMRGTPVPAPGTTVRKPLFAGTLHFAQLTFHTPRGTFVIPPADMSTMIAYTRLAIGTIVDYASQYGACSASVSPDILTHRVRLGGTSYTDGDLKRWTHELSAANDLPANAAILIPSPRGVRAHGVGPNSGYHAMAAIPYSVFGVQATGLTVEDRTDSFAMVVSHEIAELIVDPAADHENPEVCDPCDVNCGKRLHRAYFGTGGTYLGTTQSLPPPYEFAYYVCAVVKPAGASHCPASTTNCVYAPGKR
jgi:hypothetical protein